MYARVQQDIKRYFYFLQCILSIEDNIALLFQMHWCLIEDVGNVCFKSLYHTVSLLPTFVMAFQMMFCHAKHKELDVSLHNVL